MSWLKNIGLALELLTGLFNTTTTIVDTIEGQSTARGMGAEKKRLAMTGLETALTIADGLDGDNGPVSSAKHKSVILGASSCLIDGVVLYRNASAFMEGSDAANRVDVMTSPVEANIAHNFEPKAANDQMPF